MDQKLQKNNHIFKDNNKIQIIEENGVQYILEGKAKIITKKITQSESNFIEEQVFYNPVQIFNRDLTVLAIEAFGRIQQIKLKERFLGLNILDALSASGLRSIRFVKEIDQVLLNKVYANDLSTASITLIKENIQANKIDDIQITHKDANLLLFESSLNQANIPKFDVIDLDPYGSIGPFLDGAIHACNNLDARETLLCITCTDSRVLCGPDQQKCFTQYGTSRVKIPCFAENGLRTLLYTISSAAAKLGKTINPLLSIYGEFYLRVFVSVKRDKSDALKLISKIGNIFVCPQCSAYWSYPYGSEQTSESGGKIYKGSKEPIRSKCGVCESNLRINGPIWLGKLNDEEFINQMQIELIKHQNTFQTYEKVGGKLQGILNQIKFEQTPLSYNFCYISSTLRSSNVSKKEIYAGLQSLGFDFAQSYLQPNELKTNCPPEAAYDLVKSWKQLKCPGKEYLKNVQENTAIHRILTSPIQYHPNFNQKIQKSIEPKQFMPNPEKFWGPKQKAVQKKIIKTQQDSIQSDNMMTEQEIDQVTFDQVSKKIKE